MTTNGELLEFFRNNALDARNFSIEGYFRRRAEPAVPIQAQ